MVEREKNRLLDAYFSSRDASSSSELPTSAKALKMTMRNGCLVKKEAVDQSTRGDSSAPGVDQQPVQTSESDSKPQLLTPSVKTEPEEANPVPEEEQEPEEMPEIDYDDDEAIAAAAQAWSAPIISAVKQESQDVKPTAAQLAGGGSQAGEEYEEEEGAYSDEDVAQGTPAISFYVDNSADSDSGAFRDSIYRDHSFPICHSIHVPRCSRSRSCRLQAPVPIQRLAGAARRLPA